MSDRTQAVAFWAAGIVIFSWLALVSTKREREGRPWTRVGGSARGLTSPGALWMFVLLCTVALAVVLVG